MSIDKMPGSVEQAILMAMNILSDEETRLLRNTPEDKLSGFHYSLCASIRDALGLWRSEAEELLLVIAESDPTPPSVKDWGDSLSIDAAASAMRQKLDKSLNDYQSVNIWLPSSMSEYSWSKIG